MNCTRIQLTIGLILLLGALPALAASSLQQQRLARHQARSLTNEPSLNRNLSTRYSGPEVSLGGADYLDAKIFSDQYAANFAQRFPDLVHFPNGTGLAVWEDERNGDWDIFAEIFSAEGNPSGNLDLLADNNFTSQRQPQVAVDGSEHLALVWTEEEDGGVHAAVFDKNLSQVSAPSRLDDAEGANTTNLPAVAGLSTGGFVVVWEDIRSGANIYCQYLDANGTPYGSNFRVNDDVSVPSRIAPAIAADGSGNVAVVWEDGRDGDEDVFFKVYNSFGEPQTADLKVADESFENAYQFNGQVGFVDDGYFVATWISDRNDEQGVYGQLIGSSGIFSGSNFQINSASTDTCWDLRAKNTSDGGVALCWTNLYEMATIDYAFLGTDGAVALSDEAQDADAPGERGAPVLCWSADGGTALWMDDRNGNQDIYAQDFDDSKMLSNSNWMLNDDMFGSQQLSPDVAPLPDGNLAVVWRDQRNDQGDIYFQITSLGGSPVFGAQMLNDDSFGATQQAPRIVSSEAGGILVVWEDNREFGAAFNKKIMGQFLNLSGSKQGGNILVSEDPAGAAQSSPAVAAASSGYSLAIWTEETVPSKSVVLQAYSPSGGEFGDNSTLPTPPASTDNFDPCCGLQADGDGVASWTSVVDGQRVQYFQRLSELVMPEGDPEMLELTSSESEVLGADIFVHPTNGEFHIAVVESQPSTTDIKLFHFNETVSLEGGVTSVATDVGAEVQDLRVTGDVDDALLVTWTQLDGGQRRAYGRLIHQSGNPLGDIFHLGEGNALETSPSAAMLSGQYFTVWCDNRTPGYGFDLFANSVIYTSAATDEENIVLPDQVVLHQNYPNPFNPSTTIDYTVQRPGWVKLEVLNLLGQRVATLHDGYRAAGSYRTSWNAQESTAGSSASGVYFYRLITDQGVLTRKMTLLK